MARDDNPTTVPASLEAAWGLRPRPRRGPKPALSLERIVEAAVAVAGSEGLGAVSMSRVAAEAGASTMSLYRYVASKDELLALMVDAALSPPSPPEGDEDWRAGLERCAWSLMRALRAHPWALEVPISGPPTTPNQLAWFDDALAALRATGLAEHEKASTVLLVSGYVRNVATLEASLAAGYAAAGATPDEAMQAWTHLVARLNADGRFPAVAEVLRAGVFDRADDPDDEFVFGLERVLDGVELLVRERAAARARRPG